LSHLGVRIGHESSLGGGIKSRDYKESHPDRKGRRVRRIDDTWQTGYASPS
jgi:hypothetical protein